MLNFKEYLKNPFFKYSLIAVSIFSLGYIFFRLTIYPSDPLLPFFNPLTKAYLYFSEGIANFCFKHCVSNVIIKDHEFFFLKNKEAWHPAFVQFIESKANWPKSFYVNYKKWSAILLFLIWATIYPIRKKALYSLIFIVTHMVSIVGGLLLIGVVFPGMINDKTSFILKPTILGTSAMFILISIWVKLNKEDVNHSLQRFRINIFISGKMVNEIIVLLLLLLVLTEYIIPTYDFNSYIHALLEITGRITSLWNYNAYIDGDLLVGVNNSLGISKACLGLKTMFIFASLVFLTRPKEYQRKTFLFILSGIAFLFILNIIRFVLLFIIAQGENGVERALNHHEIYNAIIYVFIFLLWVIWYEFFIRKAKSSGHRAQDPELRAKGEGCKT